MNEQLGNSGEQTPKTLTDEEVDAAMAEMLADPKNRVLASMHEEVATAEMNGGMDTASEEERASGGGHDANALDPSSVIGQLDAQFHESEK